MRSRSLRKRSENLNSLRRTATTEIQNNANTLQDPTGHLQKETYIPLKRK